MITYIEKRKKQPLIVACSLSERRSVKYFPMKYFTFTIISTCVCMYWSKVVATVVNYYYRRRIAFSSRLSSSPILTRRPRFLILLEDFLYILRLMEAGVWLMCM